MSIAQVLTATGQQVFSVLRWPTSWRHHNYTPLSRFQCVACQSYVTQSSVTVQTAWDVDTGLAKCFNQWSSPVNQHWTSSSVGSHCPNKHRAMCPDLPSLIVINRLGKKNQLWRIDRYDCDAGLTLKQHLVSSFCFPVWVPWVVYIHVDCWPQITNRVCLLQWIII